MGRTEPRPRASEGYTGQAEEGAAGGEASASPPGTRSEVRAQAKEDRLGSGTCEGREVRDSGARGGGTFAFGQTLLISRPSSLEIATARHFGDAPTLLNECGARAVKRPHSGSMVSKARTRHFADETTTTRF